MSHGHRTGRQEAARTRRRQRQMLRVAGAVIGVAVLAIAAMLIFGGNEDEVEPVTADVPEPSGEATWTTDAFTGGPRLAVDRTEHNEGSIAYGHEVQASFGLKNVGDEPLTLDAVSVTTLEGCWPTDPVVGQTTLEPGQETTLQYAFSMYEGMGGPHKFEIVVDSNDVVQPSMSLIVAGEYPKP